MLYPQNDDRIVAVDSVTSLHRIFIASRIVSYVVSGCRRRSVRRCRAHSGCWRRSSVSTCVCRSATRPTRPAARVRAAPSSSFCRRCSSSARRARTSGPTCPSGTRNRCASRCVAVSRFLLSCSTPLAVGVSTAFLSVTRVCLFYANTTQQINDRFPCTLGLGQFVDLRIVSSVLAVGYNAKHIGLCMLRVFSVFWASVNAEYLP